MLCSVRAFPRKGIEFTPKAYFAHPRIRTHMGVAPSRAT